MILSTLAAASVAFGVSTNEVAFAKEIVPHIGRAGVSSPVGDCVKLPSYTNFTLH